MAGLSPIAGLGSQQTANSGNALSSNAQMGSQEFLTLLTTELRNQDPMKPVDDTQSVAQLAQFSALSATEEMNTSFKAFQSNFGVMQAASLIGQSVTVSTPNSTGQTSNMTGTVSSIAVQNGKPYFTMNDASGNPITDNNGKPLLFSTSEIVGIGGSQASNSSGSGSGTIDPFPHVH